MVKRRTDFQAFEAALADMLAEHEGEFVVMKDGQPRKFLPSYETAIEWAYESFGLDGFFVKEVTAHGAVADFSRDVGPCAA